VKKPALAKRQATKRLPQCKQEELVPMTKSVLQIVSGLAAIVALAGVCDAAPAIFTSCGTAASNARVCDEFSSAGLPGGGVSEHYSIDVVEDGKDHQVIATRTPSQSVPGGTVLAGVANFSDVGGGPTEIALVVYNATDGNQYARLLYLAVDGRYYYWPGTGDFLLSGTLRL
jgi:hypothetical protein